MKDYYNILEVTPMSTRDDIKRQYRKLAQQYHPDKNAEDAYAAAKFHDIKEAYETLTQPAKKEAWLKDRWLSQVYNTGPGETAPLTPFSILDKTLKLERHIAAMDVFRMDHFGVATRIEKIISPENLECLEKFRETDVTRNIIQHLLYALQPLSYSMTEPILKKLEALAGKDERSHSAINRFRKLQKDLQRKDRWQLPLVVLATLILCLIIWLSNR
jgi:curved DNA-binding protein CbpA